MGAAFFPEGAGLAEDAAVAVVICAAGSSARMRDAGAKKEYRAMPGDAGGLTVLGAAFRAFAALPEIQKIVIAVPDDPATGEAAARDAIGRAELDAQGTRAVFVAGGKTRRESVFNALSALSGIFPAEPGARGYALIHDGARPWVARDFIRRVIANVRKRQAVVPLLPLTDTPKVTTLPMGDFFCESADENIGENICVKTHLKRAFVGAAQTPQAFAFPDILDLHRLAAQRAQVEGIEFTDDAEIWGEFRGPVAAIPGDPRNRKITFPEDLE